MAYAAQRLINELDQTVNPAGVQGSMYLQYGTLGHLGRDTFRLEIEVAKQCEAEEPGFLKGIADSYGLGRDFDRWEQNKGLTTVNRVLVQGYKPMPVPA